jgi:hypothetical protein
MLVFEEFDEAHLHFGRAIPRDWIATGKPIEIVGAPTRWGRVNYRLERRDANTLVATITLSERSELPEELHITFRVERDRKLRSATINGKAAEFEGPHQDAIVVRPRGQRSFEAVALLA